METDTTIVYQTSKGLLYLQEKVSFATEILERFYPKSCPHCERALNWRDYINPEEIVKYIKGGNNGTKTNQ